MITRLTTIKIEMSVIRPFMATDMFKFNNINLDIWTETYGVSFYLSYLSRWPDLCCVQEAHSGRMMGYILGKAEGTSNEWHGHITAVTVAPEYRRLSLARSLVNRLELVSDEHYKGFFVDLYVRCNNALAISMYEGFGYSVYRRVREYYGMLGVGNGGKDEDDAFGESSSVPPLCGNDSTSKDMRKPLSRDSMRRSVRSNGREVMVNASSVS
ncbi:acyl-CoA N-acyltransferase [Chiua virens]|nr:acyl-CoA N-acyltransferase [Chiua virens]